MPVGGVVEVKMTFKEGGAFDFHSHYERVRERLLQAVEVSREAGVAASSAMNGVDVNLDELPAYQEEGDGPLLPATVGAVVAARESVGRVGGSADGDGRGRERDEGTPVEPPPGYEEAQMAGLRDEVQRRLEREGR